MGISEGIMVCYYYKKKGNQKVQFSEAKNNPSFLFHFKPFLDVTLSIDYLEHLSRGQ